MQTAETDMKEYVKASLKSIQDRKLAMMASTQPHSAEESQMNILRMKNKEDLAQ